MARKANREMWVKHIENQRSSGLSRKKWCVDNDVNFHTFAYWVGRLKKNKGDTEPNCIDWVAVIPSKPCINDNKGTGKVTISIGNAIIDFKTDTNIESFEKVVQVLVKYV